VEVRNPQWTCIYDACSIPFLPAVSSHPLHWFSICIQSKSIVILEKLSGSISYNVHAMQHKSKGLLDLPREVIRNIALHIYDPLELTQQDRLSKLSHTCRHIGIAHQQHGVSFPLSTCTKSGRTPWLRSLRWGTHAARSVKKFV
jgi:hypothetical protein